MVLPSQRDDPHRRGQETTRRVSRVSERRWLRATRRPGRPPRQDDQGQRPTCREEESVKGENTMREPQS
ncbi:hypothetical protein Taro_015087 [Colocasia esculenta]|uniref:Uncharacterized protein n=1 Tax=Colocasia esculenta TaxID=4460 RepID=A0A843UAQ5_COLES|nr:hypothetical protein [Colocasia esculenta]